MVKRFGSIIRIITALLLSVFATSLVPVMAAYATPQPWSEPTNHVEYWQNLGYGTCTKIDNPGGTSYTLGTPAANTYWSLLVVKAAQVNEVYENPQAGTAYNAPVNDKNEPRDVSHVIYCYKPTPVTSVTPAAPTATDVCGSFSDSYTVPATTGVVYKINAAVVPAGIYFPWMTSATSVTITAEPASDQYTLSGTTSWTFDFTNRACDTVGVQVQEACVDKNAQDGQFAVTAQNDNGIEVYYVVFIDGGADSQFAYVAPNSSHTFTFTGYGPGTYDINVIKVTANVPLPLQMLVPANLPELMLSNQPLTSLNFKDVYEGNVTLDKCPCEDEEEPEEPVDVCPNISGNQTNPADCQPGSGGNPTTPPTSGQVLGDSTGHTSSISTNLPSTLPATGSVVSPSGLIPLAGAAITYLIAYRKNSRKKSEA